MEKKTASHNGIVYTRHKGRNYYTPSGSYIAKGYPALHRQVWLDAGRAIPEGHHIHHIDGNPDNNRIENLECISASDHGRLHLSERVDDIRAARIAWSDRPEGKSQLRRNAEKMRANTPRPELACSHCGGAFVSASPRQKYCCAACAEASSGRDTACEICGTVFKVKPHNTKQVRTCSYRCGWALRRKNAGLQPDG